MDHCCFAEEPSSDNDWKATELIALQSNIPFSTKWAISTCGTIKRLSFLGPHYNSLASVLLFLESGS